MISEFRIDRFHPITPAPLRPFSMVTGVKWLLAISLALAAAISARAEDDLETVASLLELVIEVDEASAKQCLATLSSKVQTGELDAKQRESLKAKLGETVGKIVAKRDHSLFLDCVILAASWRDPAAFEAASRLALSPEQSAEHRLQALAAIISSNSPDATSVAAEFVSDKRASAELRGAALAVLGKTDDPKVSELVLSRYAAFEPELQPKAIELLTQRVGWSKALLAAIGDGKIPASALNVNQVAKLQASSDPDLKKLVAAKWGAVRQTRNPQREKVVAQMRERFQAKLGDPHQGKLVFQKVCGQCHKIYGEGHDVGPEITLNGRASFEQLLSNVFDPSLVIGAAYQARQVATVDGRVLTGLLAEENDERIVLKLQGGKVETIPREDVEEINISPLSLMPEGLENQLKAEELLDLFAFILLDRLPTDRDARLIPGAPNAIAAVAAPEKVAEAKSLFNGRDLEGWEVVGDVKEDCWKVEGEDVVCTGKPGGWLRSKEEFGDFELDLEYKLKEGGNSGVYIRVPADGNHHGEGSGIEVQMLDDASPRYKDLKDYQYSGSLYAIVAAKPRVAKPAGEWNHMTIKCVGTKYEVTHNGEKIIDADVASAPELAKRRTSGHLGLQNHNEEVRFRSVRLTPK